MGIIIKDFKDIKIHSNKIIGVLGNNYDRFLASFIGDDIYYISKIDKFYTNTVLDEINLYNNDNNVINSFLYEFELDSDFLNRKINDLSYGEKRILKYFITFLINKKIIVIDEPFLFLDYKRKKNIISLIKKIVYNTNKTFIIGSSDSDIIYSLCNYVLFVNNDNYYYDESIKAFSDETKMALYNINIPKLVNFTMLAKDKKINIDYCNNVNDLIKEVYRNV